MTEKLAGLSGEKPLILKLKETISIASPKDSISLGKDVNSKLWQRSIILGNNQPWLLGYTLAYPSHQSGPLQPLQTIGRKPLGSKLFASKEVWRVSYQTGFVSPAKDLWITLQDWLPAVNYKLWARRSLFSFHSEALLIYEVFLPTCPGFKYPYE